MTGPWHILAHPPCSQTATASVLACATGSCVCEGPILLLTGLLRGLAVPSHLPGAQPGTLRTLHDVAPHLVAVSFGAMFGVAEVVNTFPAFTAEALGTKWATLLVLFNALSTSIVYAIVIAYAVTQRPRAGIRAERG